MSERDAITKAVEALKKCIDHFGDENPDDDWDAIRDAREALAALTALQEQPAPDVEYGHTMIVRRNSPEHAEYLKARFADKSNSSTFMWAGHRWRYEHSSFDDEGEFDVLWRPPALQPSPAREEAEALVKRLYAADPYDTPRFVQELCEDAADFIARHHLGEKP